MPPSPETISNPEIYTIESGAATLAKIRTIEGIEKYYLPHIERLETFGENTEATRISSKVSDARRALRSDPNQHLDDFNEDHVRLTADGSFVGVFDGAGGEGIRIDPEAPMIASRAAGETAYRAIASDNLSFGTEEEVEKFLRDIIKLSDEQVVRSGPGATTASLITKVKINGREAFALKNIGDGNVLLYTPTSGIKKQFREQGRGVNLSNAIGRNVDVESDPAVFLYIDEMEPDSVLLAVSDGVTDHKDGNSVMGDAELTNLYAGIIEKGLSEWYRPETIANAINKAALKNDDRSTGVIIVQKSENHEPMPPKKQNGSRHQRTKAALFAKAIVSAEAYGKLSKRAQKAAIIGRVAIPAAGLVNGFLASRGWDPAIGLPFIDLFDNSDAGVDENGNTNLLDSASAEDSSADFTTTTPDFGAGGEGFGPGDSLVTPTTTGGEGDSFMPGQSITNPGGAETTPPTTAPTGTEGLWDNLNDLKEDIEEQLNNQDDGSGNNNEPSSMTVKLDGSRLELENVWQDNFGFDDDQSHHLQVYLSKHHPDWFAENFYQEGSDGLQNGDWRMGDTFRENPRLEIPAEVMDDIKHFQEHPDQLQDAYNDALDIEVGVRSSDADTSTEPVNINKTPDGRPLDNTNSLVTGDEIKIEDIIQHPTDENLNHLTDQQSSNLWRQVVIERRDDLDRLVDRGYLYYDQAAQDYRLPHDTDRLYLGEDVTRDILEAQQNPDSILSEEELAIMENGVSIPANKTNVDRDFADFLDIDIDTSEERAKFSSWWNTVKDEVLENGVVIRSRRWFTEDFLTDLKRRLP